MKGFWPETCHRFGSITSEKIKSQYIEMNEGSMQPLEDIHDELIVYVLMKTH